jgi:hypothetical protein
LNDAFFDCFRRPRPGDQAAIAAIEARDMADLEEQLAKMDGLKDRVVG